MENKCALVRLCTHIMSGLTTTNLTMKSKKTKNRLKMRQKTEKESMKYEKIKKRDTSIFCGGCRFIVYPYYANTPKSIWVCVCSGVCMCARAGEFFFFKCIWRYHFVNITFMIFTVFIFTHLKVQIELLITSSLTV